MKLDGEEFLLRALERRALTPQAADALRARGLGDALPGAAVRDGVLAVEVVADLLAELGVVLPDVAGYRLLAPLGEGASGSVWLAQANGAEQRVALKLVRTQDADDAARFVREARALQAIDHPRVVRCLDVGEHKGTPFLALELVLGGDAERLLRTSGRVAERRALELVRDAAEGLAAIHAAGLLHRDLKPANLMLDADGRAKVADFGLARTLDDRLTRTGAVIGTPAYMPPEQARGDATIDQRCDIYALGATLFALVTGQPPYRGRTPWEIVGKVAKEPAPDPRDLCPDLSAPAAMVIRCAMARDRDARYASAEALREDCADVRAGGAPRHAARLRRLAGEASVAQQPAVAVAPRRNPAPVAWALTAGAAAVLLAIGWTSARAATAPSPQALRLREVARVEGSAATWQAVIAVASGAVGDEARAQLALVERAEAAEAEAEPTYAVLAADAREVERLTAERERLRQAIAQAERERRDAPSARGRATATPSAPPAPANPAPVAVAAQPTVIAAPAAVATPTPPRVAPPDLLLDDAGPDLNGVYTPAPVPPADGRSVSAGSIAKAVRLATLPDDNRLRAIPLPSTAGPTLFDRHPHQPNRLIAAFSGVIMTSEDVGRSWQRSAISDILSGVRGGMTDGRERAYRDTSGDRVFLPYRPDYPLVGALSDDGGRTFRAIGAPWRTRSADHTSSMLPDGTLVARGPLEDSRHPVFVSRDGGAGWRRLDVTVGKRFSIATYEGRSALIDGDNPTRISVDVGATWSTLPFGPVLGEPAATSGALILTGPKAFLTVGWDGTVLGEAPFGGMDALEGWRIRRLHVDPQRPELLYLVVSGRPLLRSPDGGRSWQEAASPLTEVMDLDSWTPPTIRSEGGRTWIGVLGTHARWIEFNDRDGLFAKVATGTPPRDLVPAGAPAGTRLDVLGDAVVGWVTLDPGNVGRWTAMISGTIHSTADGGGTVDRITPERSTTGGLQWIGRAVRSRRNADRVFVAAKSPESTVLGALSRDGSRTFTPVRCADHSGDLAGATMLDDGTLVTLLNRPPQAVATSLDDGATWSRSDLAPEVKAAALVAVEGGCLLVVDDQDGTHVSPDFGRTWARRQPEQRLRVATWISGYPLRSTRFAEGALMSTQGGLATFDRTGGFVGFVAMPFALGTNHLRGVAAHVTRPAVFYAIANGLGLMRTTDAGRTWWYAHHDLQCEDREHVLQVDHSGGRSWLLYRDHRQLLVRLDDTEAAQTLFPYRVQP